MIKLTKRQSEVLDHIKQHIATTGYPPTRAELARILGFRSANAAEEHLRALARKGAIEMVPGASRGIRLPEPVQDGLPIVGRVAAGSPVLAQEHIDSHIKVPDLLFQPAADYFLRVNGNSMKNVGIMDGDLLAVHKTDEAKEGQIIVARLQDDVTVKRLKYGENRYNVELHPENDEFDVIRVDLRTEPFAIEGLSVGVIRQGM